MSKSSNYSPEQLQNKLIDKLQESGWADLLKGFLRSSDFAAIIEFLIKENNEGRRFTPQLKQLFTAFEYCPVDKVKVVMIGQDPYPQVLVADGLAFSCSNTNKAEASLRYILSAVERTVPSEDKAVIQSEDTYNLARWAKQGVLLLNSAFTTEVGKVGKHTDIWKPFTEYVIDMLNYRQSGLVWALLGKQAQSFDGLIGDHHSVITSTHPAYAAYQKAKDWDCGDLFNRINAQLVDYKKDKILW